MVRQFLYDGNDGYEVFKLSEKVSDDTEDDTVFDIIYKIFKIIEDCTRLKCFLDGGEMYFEFGKCKSINKLRSFLSENVLISGERAYLKLNFHKRIHLKN